MRVFNLTLSLSCLAACGLGVLGCSDGSSGGTPVPLAPVPTADGTGTATPPPPPPGDEPAPPPPGGDPVAGTPPLVSDATLLAELANDGIATPAQVAPESADMIALGRALFFDKVLSGNNNISCATCHHPTAGSGDDLPLPLGEGATGLGAARVASANDQVIARNAPPLWHVSARGATSMFWDARVTRNPNTGVLQTPEPALNGAAPARPDMTAQLTTALAAQAMFPPTSPEEMRGDAGENALADLATHLEVWAGLMARLVGTNDGTTGGIAAYRTLFQAAFPGVANFDNLTFAHAARAIAAYEASAFAMFDTPLDRYLAGDAAALSEAAKRGGLLFTGPARCDRCHGGPLLSDLRFHAIGTPQLGPGKDANTDDLGRSLETGDNRDDYEFRTPPLRNVSESGPYFHAGAFNRLEDVLRHYRNPGQSLLNYNGAAHLPAFFQAFVDNDPTRNQARIAALDPAVRNGIPINNAELADLVAFLQALTDPAANTVTVPAAVPSGLPVAD